MKKTFTFHKGMPEKSGYFLVKLVPGHVQNPDKTYDVDYCSKQGPSDGGGWTWATWYPHNVEMWANLDDVQSIYKEPKNY